ADAPTRSSTTAHRGLVNREHRNIVVNGVKLIEPQPSRRLVAIENINPVLPKAVIAVFCRSPSCFRYRDHPRDSHLSQLGRRGDVHPPMGAPESKPATGAGDLDGRFELVLPTPRAAKVHILITVVEVVPVVQGHSEPSPTKGPFGKVHAAAI